MDPSASKLIVALDVPGLKEAERLVERLSPAVTLFKVGKELFTACGPSVLESIHARKARVFLDLKFHDIPNTVGSACAAAVRHGVFMMNVHALGGKKMMLAAAQCVRETAAQLKTKPPLLIGVTVLTSLADADLTEVGIERKAAEEAEKLALLAKECGLDGVVASGREIELIRKAAGRDFVIVTPGVRPAGAVRGDQQRIVTPREALQKGADYIVVGRPITQAPDPLAAARKILEETDQVPNLRQKGTR